MLTPLFTMLWVAEQNLGPFWFGVTLALAAVSSAGATLTTGLVRLTIGTEPAPEQIRFVTWWTLGIGTGLAALFTSGWIELLLQLSVVAAAEASYRIAPRRARTVKGRFGVQALALGSLWFLATLALPATRVPTPSGFAAMAVLTGGLALTSIALALVEAGKLTPTDDLVYKLRETLLRSRRSTPPPRGGQGLIPESPEDPVS